MKNRSIKWIIFKYNLILIALLIILASVVFLFVTRFYMERDIVSQMRIIADRAEEVAVQNDRLFPQNRKDQSGIRNNSIHLIFNVRLNRALTKTMTILNAECILLDKNKDIIYPLNNEFVDFPELTNQIIGKFDYKDSTQKEKSLNFKMSGSDYIALIKPVSDVSSFNLKWIIVYSRLDKVNQIQNTIVIILLIILGLSSIIIILLSSLLSKKISAPFSSINQQIRTIAERKFGSKIQLNVESEFHELVNNINLLSDKLETYDKAQKTFIQNASHEFRTPLMSILGYAEGLEHGLVDKSTAARIITDESRRLTNLVEDLLYLSRLEAIEESYDIEKVDFKELINSCSERMEGIAVKNNIKLVLNMLNDKLEVMADEEKLSRAITNVISNSIRYAAGKITITVTAENLNLKLQIADDGPGIDKVDLPFIFDRFYKGKRGKFGLGLAISKNIIEKHKGSITAKNSENEPGAVFEITIPISD